MSGVPIVTKQGPKTFKAAELITGGQVVEARAMGRVGVAAAGTTKYVGVAVIDAINPEAVVTTSAVVAGRPVLNAAAFPTNVAVAYGGMEVPVTYAAAAVFGESLVAAANGQVTPAGATPTAGTIVGRCTAPAGVAAGAVGLMRTA